MKRKRRARTKAAPRIPGFLAGAALGLLAAAGLGSGGDLSARAAVPPTAETPAAPLLETAPETRLTAVGDLVFSRRIADRLPVAGWNELFAHADGLLSESDIVFGNLETPASYRGTPYPEKDPAVTFRAPPGVLLGVKEAGFTVLSLANNHINDYGGDALADTLDALDAAGIARCGAGRNEEEARRPAVLEAGGRRFAFIAYTERMWSVVAAGSGPGTVWIDETRIAEDIEKAERSADFVVVSLHWGEEHNGTPRETDRALARRLVDAGADAVIGHHPHVLQGAEFYRGKPILYSLGNFIFDMVSSKTYDTAAASIVFGPEGPREVFFAPARIDERTFGPAPASGADAERIGALLAERCAAVGASLDRLADGTLRLRPPGAYRTPSSRSESSSSVYGLGITPLNP